MVLFASLLPDALYVQPGLSSLREVAVRHAPLSSPSSPMLRAQPLQAPPLGFASALIQQQLAQAAAAPSAAAALAAPRPARLPSLIPAVAYSTKEKESLGDTLRRAGKKALGGGIPGAAAMAVQVRLCSPGGGCAGGCTS